MSTNKRISVRDIMKTDYGSIDRNATIAEALEAMARLKTTMLVVDKRDEDDEFGILLVSDIARKVLALDRASSRVNTYEIMSKPIIGVGPDMDVRYCARLFDRFGLSVTPVVDNGKVIGIVTYGGLVMDGLCRMIE